MILISGILKTNFLLVFPITNQTTVFIHVSCDIKRIFKKLIAIQIQIVLLYIVNLPNERTTQIISINV